MTSGTAVSLLLDAVLSYIKRGWSVFPVGTDKKPLVKWALYQIQPPDESQVRDWWTEWPEANIALTCGPVSGVVVLDVDGDDGMRVLEEKSLHLPDTLTVKTGRGWHFYFKDPGVPTRNFARGKTTFPLPRVDFRGKGGYVVIPPSRHASGVHYQLVKNIEPAPLPQWLRDLVIQPTNPETRPQPRSRSSVNGSLATRILNEAIQSMTGGNRNETGLWLACQLRDNGLDKAEAMEIMTQYAEAVSDRGDHPYGKQEASATVQSAYSRSAREPWTSSPSLSRGPRGPGGPPPIQEPLKVLDHSKNPGGPGGPETDEFMPVPGYLITPDGVFELPANINKPDIRLTLASCGVIAHCRDGLQQNWGAFVRWADRDGVIHEAAFPVGRFHDESVKLCVDLANLGLPIMPSKEKQLLRYFASSDPKTRYRAAIQTGWQDHEAVFVLPTKTIGGSVNGELVVYQPERFFSSSQGVCTAGSFEDWKHQVAAQLPGNPVLVFWAAASFAAPLLHMLALEGGGVHLYGITSTGKTTVEQVAASVWGNGSDPAEGQASAYVRKWNLTKNATEGLAEAYNDLPLCLDEIAEADAREFGRMIYQLAGGQGKGRMRADATLKSVKAWRILLLSTGEAPAADVIEAEGKRMKGGQAVRLLDIPAIDPGTGAGIIVDVYGTESPALFVDALKRACGSHYGWAGPAFVKALIDEGLERVRKELGEILLATAQALSPDGASPEVARAVKRLALVAVAGEKATALGILPWEQGEAFRATRAILSRYLAGRCGVGSETERAIDRVRAFILAHGASRFRDLTKDSDHVVNLVGYRDQLNEIYYLTPSGFREACGGQDVKDVARLLARKGLLRVPDTGHLTERVSVPGVGRTRLYAVDADILDTETAPAGPLDRSI